MFKDKVYEEMDHLSKLVDEYEDELSDKLAAIPKIVEVNRLPLDVAANNLTVGILLCNGDTPYSLHSREIQYVLEQHIFEVDVESVNGNHVVSDRGFVVFDRPVIINKLQHRLKPEQILEFAQYRTVSIPKEAKAAELNDLIRALIPDKENADALKTRSLRKKRNILENYIRQTIILKNSWNIRNTQLFSKLAQWMYGAALGNLACKANIMKLACMRHNGHGIYSMEEIV